MKQDKLSRRLKEVVLATTTDYRRFKQLEDVSEVAADSWKSWFHGRQRPTAEMIEAAATNWPEYAFWLITGVSDAEYGHIAPGDEGFPRKAQRKENSANLFRATIQLKAEAVKATTAYFEAEDLDLELCDRTTAMGIDLILRSTDLPLGVEKTSVAHAKRNQELAAKLRRAEILAETEMPAITYDATDSLISTIEDVLRDVPDKAKAKLVKILDDEKTKLERHKLWEAKRLAEQSGSGNS